MKLRQWNTIIVSISGGKDSQVCLDLISRLAKEQRYSGQLLAIHADTGAEWPQTLGHCRYLCQAYGVPLHVATPHRLLPDHIERRCRMLLAAGKKGGWPSPACRYCTSDCKRNPIQKVIRGMFPAMQASSILVVTGERRQESPHRAKLEEIEIDARLCAGSRQVTSWRPILDYRLEDVWDTIRASGYHRHIAYDLGNERLSCALCVLATDRDIRNGAVHCPELRDRYLKIEAETGHTFKNKKRLSEIIAGERIQNPRLPGF